MNTPPDTSFSNNEGFDQTRELAKLMHPYIEIIDKLFATREVPLSLRCLLALDKMLEARFISVEAAGEDLFEGRSKEDVSETIYYRLLYEAVEYWYCKHYGEGTMEAQGNQMLSGAQMIRGHPYALSIPENRTQMEEPGESSWMYFEDGLGEGEVATNWIVDGPDLEELDSEAMAIVAAETKQTAEVLRDLCFRKNTPPLEEDIEVNKLLCTTLTYLSSAAKRLASSRGNALGQVWWELQMANETALKAVILKHSGQQPRIHHLDKLLDQARSHGVAFDAERLSDWPGFSDISDWRYGQGGAVRISVLYNAYRMTIELVFACTSTIPPGMEPGFGLLVRYAPFRTKNALGELREIKI